MQAIFLNIACILTLFDIGAVANEKLEANIIEEHLIRYVMFCSGLCGTFGMCEVCD